MSGLTCSTCGVPITIQSQSGQCIYCSRRGSRYTKGRQCSICGKSIGDRTKYSMCLQHVREAYRKKQHLKSWRKQNYGTHQMVKCHMLDCNTRFYLESWQHPQMAYCPRCRKRDEYIGYGARVCVVQAKRPTLTPAHFTSQGRDHA